MEVLAMFKKSIGILDNDASQDEYYQNYIDMAKADLSTDDIDTAILNGEAGKTATVLYAKALYEEKDIASVPALNFWRNKLSDLTKGARHNADGQTTNSNT